MNTSLKPIKFKNHKNENDKYLYNDFYEWNRTVIDLPGEEWKQIDDFPLYYASNFGRIKKIRYQWFITGRNQCGNFATEAFYQEQLLKQKKDKYGYYQVNLYGNGKRKTVAVHRLVGFAFVDGYKDGLAINHIDENKTNNHAENLEWVTTQENDNHGTRIQRAVKTRIKSPNHKETRARINEWLKDNSPLCKPMLVNGKRHSSISAVARAFGVSDTAVRNWAKGKGKIPKGYKFEYAEK